MSNKMLGKAKSRCRDCFALIKKEAKWYCNTGNCPIVEVRDCKERRDKIVCLDCGKHIPLEAETAIRLCQDCMKNYDVDRLWKLHDNGLLVAIDFNESPAMQKAFRYGDN